MNDATPESPQSPAEEPPGAPGAVRRHSDGRKAFIASVTSVALICGVIGIFATIAALRDRSTSSAWHEGIAAGGPDTHPSPSPSPSPEPLTVSLSATGDIILGSAPTRLPRDDGQGFFDDVEQALAADLVMGNLEQPLTDDTGYQKCRAPEPTATPSPGASPRRATNTGCHQFRAPTGYAAHLADAGFDLLNQANNHGNDFGPAGYRNTQKALEEHDLAHTGGRDQITVVEAGGLDIAVVGFSPYAWSNNLSDIDAAKRLVRKASGRADLVVVQAHMGAEGSGKTRVTPGTEMFLGENRGDPIRFSHAVIDAGADLVVGHGPHVLRGMEFYKGRLIAYSLGNFAGGGGTLSAAGPLGIGGILKVSLRPDGEWDGGEFISTRMVDGGHPSVDRRGRGLKLIRDLSERDFPTTGPVFEDDGGIVLPPS